MPNWKPEIRRRLAGLMLEPTRESEIVEELAQHLEDRYQELRAEGAASAEAIRAALAELSERELLQHELRRVEQVAWREPVVLGARRKNMLGNLWQDLRYGARILRRSPGFSFVAVLTLALGIGANTAMFSVLNTYLFRALPYPNSERLVRVFRTSPHSQSWPHSPGNFFDHRDQNDVFESMAAFSWRSINMAEPGESAERAQAMVTTADFFTALGVQPMLGRVYTAEEEVRGNNGVVVLSNRFWMRRFGGDPDIIGQTLRLNGLDAKVIGVMPPGVEHPLLWNTVDLWGPLDFTPEGRRDRTSNWLQSIGRLKPGVTIEQAQDSMIALAANLAKEHPDNAGESLRLEPLQRSLSDDIGRKVMWFTFGLAGFVLLIACANLANLQLVRTAARAREYAIRAALGAARGRLLRQSLTESLVVSLIGGALSLVLALWSVGFISRRLFSNLPGAKVSLDFSVFGFALLCSVLTGLLFGTVPAWLASRADVNEALRANARGSTAGRSHQRLRHALIVGEVAFALVLLAGAGLFLRGLQRYTHLDPGWRVDGLMTAEIGLQGPKYINEPERALFYNQLEERLRAIPGVQQVALSASQPVWGFGSSGGFVVEGQPQPPVEQLPEVFFEPVSSQYFETIGAHLLEGRAFNATDIADRPEVMIINETMAREFWPNESPIGKRVGRPGANKHWREVVGVIRDMEFPADMSEPYTRFQAFLPLAQSPPWGGITMELRTVSAPEAITNALRETVAAIDPGQAVYRIQTARSIVEQGLGSISLLGALLGAFAALGFALACVGIYGVTSYSVAQRTGEIGIRMALGAQARDVLWLVLGKVARLIFFGALLGFGGAYAVARLLEAAIPTLPSRDPVMLITISVALIIVALVACYLPARRATKVDPMVALRYE